MKKFELVRKQLKGRVLELAGLVASWIDKVLNLDMLMMPEMWTILVGPVLVGLVIYGQDLVKTEEVVSMVVGIEVF